MTNWIFYKDEHPEFFDTDRAINVLLSTHNDLKEKYEKYVKSTYEDYSKERLDYVDIAVIARHIIDRILKNAINDFQQLFDRIEDILKNCYTETEDLIVVGLLESIQNLGGGVNINYWTGFDRWLKPKTKEKWDNLIFMWEGQDAIENYKRESQNKESLI